MDYKSVFRRFNLEHLITGIEIDYYDAVDILIERNTEKISPEEALNISDCLDEIRKD